MNPRLDALHPYPFEKLRALLAEAGAPPQGLTPINLSIGEPKHAAPARVGQAICDNLQGLSVYPSTKGEPALRQAISQWLSQRYSILAPDIEREVLPVLGSREALFAFTQTVVDPTADALVVCPNPFYQIYEGAAVLAGATPYFVNADPARDFGCDWARVPEDVWKRTQLVFVCSPGNPAGNVMSLQDWEVLFALSDRHGFAIASDECYSEIYFDEAPLGSLQAARRLGRDDYRNVVAFSSLSKRSNVPGMRSGFVAGDARLINRFLLYRTYHGSAMSPTIAAASVAAWGDEAHVVENRHEYRAKFEAVLPILQRVMDVRRPQAAFYLWAPTPGSDTAFARDLYARTGVTVLPGSFLARQAHGVNPGAGRVRIALVAPLAQCIEAAERIVHFIKTSV
ncbi:succinyldiaminopimelate transaminase [Bordetella holmesii]|uniref:Succinyldiaminopimelate transaminase n=2 Tax=Bordetella holmesii TaxID=35814 RepID=A0A158M9Z1_9BORD|nr:succinyldiaminopimelate transaminase [Bordetella holmesii]AHV92509.1 succinyldiaminopimelate transaminase [Bordetella holmesii ATCC 51541]EWM40680.1 succinyldiaminopimelate transaminase [Bordetella holmesii 35009]EWM41552.1 succinyldiaminopimelate transaminase [Bordetella holmesii 41130]AMD46650.1 succinyldiaminopimelate transaminase [Bordetella holmesii H558]AMD47955.1 succinyldiaminopimelate aminotransferase [Bordetella holmesii F627]